METTAFWEFADGFFAFDELAALRAVGRCADRLRDGPKRLRVVFEARAAMSLRCGGARGKAPPEALAASPRFAALSARSDLASYLLELGRAIAQLTHLELLHLVKRDPVAFLEVAKEAPVLASFRGSWLRSLRLMVYSHVDDFFDRRWESASGRLAVVAEDLAERDFVLELVKLLPEALRHLNPPLLWDREILLAALTADSSAVKWVGELEREVFVEALQVVPDVDEFLETHSFTCGFLHEDVAEVGLWLLKCGVEVDEIHAGLFHDRDFVMKAMELGDRVASQVFFRWQMMFHGLYNLPL